MNKPRAFLGMVATVAAMYVALCAYAVADQDVEELLLCADSGGLKIPFSKTVCRNYLFASRGTREDIELLHRGVGAFFVVQGESSEAEREEVLRFLVGKGLDVNRIDMHGLTPLHGAVLGNVPSEVSMLLRSGGNPRLKDRKFGLTPLELAVKLEREGSVPGGRQEVIALLKRER